MQRTEPELERGETAARSVVPKPRNDQAARYAFPSAANSRNKILAINVLLDSPNCLLLLSYGVRTVTNPSDVLYKPVTVWPLSSAVICFQRISSPMRQDYTRPRPAGSVALLMSAFGGKADIAFLGPNVCF